MNADRQPELIPWHRTSDVRGAALILPGGAARSRGRYWSFVDFGLRDLARRLVDRGEPDGLAVYLLRYRYRGWNGNRADTAVDTLWALGELERAHGGVPVALIGNSLGGRAAFWVAGEPHVASIAGIAPWLPNGDPVEQLAGRKVLIVHGSRDRSGASAERSLEYASRARSVVPDLARFEVVGDNHFLIRRAVDCWTVTTDFVVGTIGSGPLDPAISAAMTAPAPDGLRTPLAVGFGRT
jgi:predicted alpha/beta-hydrolase family hydrolase